MSGWCAGRGDARDGKGRAGVCVCVWGWGWGWVATWLVEFGKEWEVMWWGAFRIWIFDFVFLILSLGF